MSVQSCQTAVSEALPSRPVTYFIILHAESNFAFGRWFFKPTDIAVEMPLTL
jgi:hypothetical protein